MTIYTDIYKRNNENTQIQSNEFLFTKTKIRNLKDSDTKRMFDNVIFRQQSINNSTNEIVVIDEEMILQRNRYVHIIEFVKSTGESDRVFNTFTSFLTSPRGNQFNLLRDLRMRIINTFSCVVFVIGIGVPFNEKCDVDMHRIFLHGVKHLKLPS